MAQHAGHTLRLAFTTLLCVLPGYLSTLFGLWWPGIGSSDSLRPDVIGALLDLIG